MSSDQHEIEDTYSVHSETPVPDLTRLDRVATVQDEGVHDLEATYFDTEDLALAVAGISLRRRTGGADAGWHLKLPTKRGRFEVHEDLSRSDDTVPASLGALVAARTRRAPLAPVAVIRTRRHLHRLLDESGDVLAELCDDLVDAEVSAEVRGGPSTSAWREWELELVAAGPSFLEAASGLLQDAGGTPAGGSKLRHALGDRVPVRAEDVLPRATRKGPSSLVVQARLREQVEAIRRYDPLVRHDVPDAVHKMRVGVRRLRTALASYRPVLVREQVEPVRGELKWLAAVLGEPRDTEVMRARLEEMLADEPPEVVRGAGYERMGEEMDEEYARARARLLEALSSERYFRLLDRLAALAAEPPWREQAATPVHGLLRKRLRHDYGRLVQRVEHADEADEEADEEADDGREHRLHEARKAVKRVRYAAEALTGVYGKPAEEFVKAMKRVQSRLGDHHDAHVTQHRLRELGDEAASTGDNAFVFGVLHAREERALSQGDDEFVREWRRASRKKLRRWMSR